MELYSFEEEYLARLRARDLATETHFFEYFNGLLMQKLRAGGYSDDDSSDIRSEMLNRALKALGNRKLERPRRLNVFVFEVCKLVEVERRRRSAR